MSRDEKVWFYFPIWFAMIDIFISEYLCFCFQDEWNLQEEEDQKALEAQGQISFLKGLNEIFLKIFEMNEIFKKKKTEDLLNAKGKTIKHKYEYIF